MSALDISGEFDIATQSELRKFLNDNWKDAGYRTKHLSGSKFNAAHIKAVQTFLNAQTLGPVLPIDGHESPEMIKLLRKFLNKNWDKAGFRPKKLSLTGKMDGGFQGNRGTVKALQHFLNTVHGLSGTADKGSNDSGVSKDKDVSASKTEPASAAPAAKSASTKPTANNATNSDKTGKKPPSQAPVTSCQSAGDSSKKETPKKDTDTDSSVKQQKSATTTTKPSKPEKQEGPKESVAPVTLKVATASTIETTDNAAPQAKKDDATKPKPAKSPSGSAQPSPGASPKTTTKKKIGRPRSLKRGKKTGGKIGGLLAKMGGSIMMPGMKPPPKVAAKLEPSTGGGGAKSVAEVEESTKTAVTSRPAVSKKRRPATRKKFSFSGSAKPANEAVPKAASGNANSTSKVDAADKESDSAPESGTNDVPDNEPAPASTTDVAASTKGTGASAEDTGAVDTTATPTSLSDALAPADDGESEPKSEEATEPAKPIKKKKSGNGKIGRRKSGQKRRSARINALAAGLGGIKIGMPGMANP